jgi:hypothetical protein
MEQRGGNGHVRKSFSDQSLPVRSAADVHLRRSPEQARVCLRIAIAGLFLVLAVLRHCSIVCERAAEGDQDVVLVGTHSRGRSVFSVVYPFQLFVTGSRALTGKRCPPTVSLRLPVATVTVGLANMGRTMSSCDGVIETANWAILSNMGCCGFFAKRPGWPGVERCSRQAFGSFGSPDVSCHGRNTYCRTVLLS